MPGLKADFGRVLNRPAKIIKSANNCAYYPEIRHSAKLGAAPRFGSLSAGRLVVLLGPLRW
jgi:hypothetical protein